MEYMATQNRQGWRYRVIITVAAILCLGVAIVFPNEARAQCGSSCGCVFTQRDATIAHIRNEHQQTRLFITNEFRIHQNWLFGANGVTVSFFHDHILPALMMMTEQLTTNGMAQMFILGAFFDAKNQLETQRIYQVKAAEAHKDYHPSFEMCVIGTNTRSLAASHRNSEFSRFVLGERSLARGLGMWAQSSAYDSTEDRENRLDLFVRRYCDPHDNNDITQLLCFMTPNRFSVNKDIDYGRTIDHPKSLDVDFTVNVNPPPLSTPVNNGELDIMALASNLYNSDVLDRFDDKDNLLAGQEHLYNDVRGIAAKRTVIENSFNAIVGLKTMGSNRSATTTTEYMQKVMEQLGVTSASDQLYMLTGETDRLVGSGPAGARNVLTPTGRVSYYEQLEILAQKIYHNPDFFVSLYDKPTNVSRKDVAMQAIGLMLNREMFESELRSEMVMAVMLELEIMKYQADIQNRINALIDE